MSAQHGTIERQCWRKHAYKTERQAKDAARRMQWRAVLPLQVYKCDNCLRWHIARMRRIDAARLGL